VKGADINHKNVERKSSNRKRRIMSTRGLEVQGGKIPKRVHSMKDRITRRLVSGGPCSGEKEQQHQTGEIKQLCVGGEKGIKGEGKMKKGRLIEN